MCICGPGSSGQIPYRLYSCDNSSVDPDARRRIERKERELLSNKQNSITAVVSRNSFMKLPEKIPEPVIEDAGYERITAKTGNAVHENITDSCGDGFRSLRKKRFMNCPEVRKAYIDRE